MKLVVGLGNPGRKYQATRHNIGYEVLWNLARRYATGSPKSSFQGELVDADLAGVRALLLWPQTYMNRSGVCVVQARDFYKLENSDLLVVCDDFNLPLARLRVRAKGSSGGQKGLEDIIRALGTDEFARLRVGIGSPPENWEAANYVLGKFNKQELTEIEPAIGRAADAAVEWARSGLEPCMNRYNA
ncbi:MAG TPA: aminoacyl-tRNA hydrolase [Pirellulales bacterium]|jgi:PTH1 family peptidyl-tRNA hydrolase|nr:aminoacyl-tRNA hydrolase [Pirellulales bacterium]